MTSPEPLDMIVKTNYGPLLGEIVESTGRWMSLPLSFIGRNNILKMNTVPKLFYLFQNIPLPPPGDFFQKLGKLFIKFIWKNNRARIQLVLLHLAPGILSQYSPIWETSVSPQEKQMLYLEHGHQKDMYLPNTDKIMSFEEMYDIHRKYLFQIPSTQKLY